MMNNIARFASQTTSVWLRCMLSVPVPALVLSILAGTSFAMAYVLVLAPAVGADGGLGGVPRLFSGIACLIILSTVFVDNIDRIYVCVHVTRTYRHLLDTTPVAPLSLILGDCLAALTRCGMFLVATVVIAGYSLGVEVGLVIQAVAVSFFGAAPLTALCFAIASTARNARQVDTRRFMLLPAFLLSGALFPVDAMPAVLRLVATSTPLWHVDQLLLRLFGQASQPWWCAPAYLVVLGAGSVALAVRGLRS